MRYRQLGSSSLRVSEISLGTWLTTSGGVERSQAIACVRRALDLGITFIDTANVYGRGTAAKSCWPRPCARFLVTRTCSPRSFTFR